MIKIYVGGFPLEMSELELVQLVSPYGEVSTIKIVRNKATKKCKGYAFLEMTSREAADNVIKALDGAAIGDRQLTISIKEDEQVRPVSVYKKVERRNDPVKKKRPRI
ncbi:RNA recognition motif domain-containing protein [Mucilaginibacter sp.]